MDDRDGPTTPPRRRWPTLTSRFVRRFVYWAHGLLTLPWLVAALFYNPKIQPTYRVTFGKALRLAWRMYRNTRRIPAGTTYKAHLVMAVKLLELPAAVEGVVVECGCYQGASTANLSLVCDLVDRDLVVYDSFEGLPEPAHGEKYGVPAGQFRGDLEVVQAHVRRWGAIERCTFRRGWFDQTLPHHTEPIALAFLDVDYQDSLRSCVLHLWPHLNEGAHLFIDEYVLLDYCALFFSEKWWFRHFQTVPPGLFGTGTGIPVGDVNVDRWPSGAPLQRAASVAFTRKGCSGFWDYYPEDIAAGKAAPAILARGTVPDGWTAPSPPAA